jgi:hypothetical protein
VNIQDFVLVLSFAGSLFPIIKGASLSEPSGMQAKSTVTQHLDLSPPWQKSLGRVRALFGCIFKNWPVSAALYMLQRS